MAPFFPMFEELYSANGTWLPPTLSFKCLPSIPALTVAKHRMHCFHYATQRALPETAYRASGKRLLGKVNNYDL